VQPGGGVRIQSSKSREYANDQIQSVSCQTHKERKFGAISAVAGIIGFSIILAPFLNVLGIVIAVVVSIAGSFYSKKRHTGEILFTDGNKVSLSIEEPDVDRLYRLPPDD